MTATLNIQEQKVTITSYPKCLVGLVVGLLLAMMIGAEITNSNASFTDYLIFSAVCGVFIIIQKHKTTVLDKGSNTVRITIKTLFNSKEERLSLSDITEVKMQYGRGSGHARGGALCLKTDGDTHVIIDSDICFGNLQKTKSIQEQLDQWREAA